jgi:hypothetical protein
MEKNENECETQKYSLAELEDMLKNDIKPNGIKEYDDMPLEDPQAPSDNKIEKPKKVNFIYFSLGKVLRIISL